MNVLENEHQLLLEEVSALSLKMLQCIIDGHLLRMMQRKQDKLKWSVYWWNSLRYKDISCSTCYIERSTWVQSLSKLILKFKGKMDAFQRWAEGFLPDVTLGIVSGKKKSLWGLWDWNLFLIIIFRGSKILYHSYCDLHFRNKPREEDEHLD